MVEYGEKHNSNSPITAKELDVTKLVAVAVQGNEDNADSPAKVIASGRGKLAQQILDMAWKRGIKVREDADLAELLATLDLDTPIPSEAIIAVAEILAKVYQANSRIATGASVQLTALEPLSR